MQLTRRTFLQAMSAALKAAPYLSDWSKTVKDGNRPRTRPQVIDNADSLRKGMDWTGERLADMDAAGVTMQILSLGGFPQFAPKRKNCHSPKPSTTASPKPLPTTPPASPPSPPCRGGSLKTPSPNWNAPSNSSG